MDESPSSARVSTPRLALSPLRTKVAESLWTPPTRFEKRASLGIPSEVTPLSQRPLNDTRYTASVGFLIDAVELADGVKEVSVPTRDIDTV